MKHFQIVAPTIIITTCCIQNYSTTDAPIRITYVCPDNYCRTTSDLLYIRLQITSDYNCHVINGHLTSAAVSMGWKHVRVVPLYRYGKSDNAIHCIPIQVLSVRSKIIESQSVANNCITVLTKILFFNKLQ